MFEFSLQSEDDLCKNIKTHEIMNQVLNKEQTNQSMCSVDIIILYSFNIHTGTYIVKVLF